MKTQSIILVVLVMLIGTAAQAQEVNVPAIKILPMPQHGILKVLYAYNSGQPVNVKFFDDDAVLFSDKIKANAFQNGFSRKYDVRNIAAKTFYVEVSSETLSVTYQLTKSEDGNDLIPVLENVYYHYPAMASRN
jgi:hypothetical protein